MPCFDVMNEFLGGVMMALFVISDIFQEKPTKIEGLVMEAMLAMTIFDCCKTNQFYLSKCSHRQNSQLF